MYKARDVAGLVRTMSRRTRSQTCVVRIRAPGLWAFLLLQVPVHNRGAERTACSCTRSGTVWECRGRGAEPVRQGHTLFRVPEGAVKRSSTAERRGPFALTGQHSGQRAVTAAALHANRGAGSRRPNTTKVVAFGHSSPPPVAPYQL